MHSAATLPFEPPGPGSWALDATHFTRPVTRFIEELFPATFFRGFGESLSRYGLLLEYLDYAFVNGFPYFCPRPVGAPKEASGHPPRDVWDELAAGHPEISARLARSAAALERRLWREDLRLWDEEVKPDCIRRSRAVQAVDPGALPRDGLAAHLERCRANAEHQLYVHHLFNVPALLPVGDFVAHAAEWTERSPAELLTLLRGATPVSRGAADELARAGEAIGRDSRARALLESAEPGEALELLRALRGAAGEAVRAYVDVVGYRLVNGEDVAEPYGLEMPDVLVSSLRSATAGYEREQANGEVAESVARVRDEVTRSRRSMFDELLAEARAVYRLRDERGLYCDLWGYGLARRAILTAGARLAGEERIEAAEHLAYAGHEEALALLGGADGPAAEELAARARYRAEASYADAPEFLGPPPGAPVPGEWLPPASARLERAIGTAVMAVFVAPRTEGPKDVVRGLPGSPGVYEGPARVVRGTEEFARIRKGDVLVTNSTTAAFNVVLPLLGAIVTDRGGVLSHAAIVAREFGIPALVGAGDATARIPDGARVRVDGAAGEAALV